MVDKNTCLPELVCQSTLDHCTSSIDYILLLTVNSYLLTIMKSLILLASCLLVVISAQRPSYAPNPIGYPGLHSRFKTEETENEENVNIGNRNSNDDQSNVTTEALPVDARGDSQLVNRIKDWPQEKRPFWYINAQHIEAARNPQRPPPTGVQQLQQSPIQTQSRSSFSGGLGRQ